MKKIFVKSLLLIGSLTCGVLAPLGSFSDTVSRKTADNTTTPDYTLPDIDTPDSKLDNDFSSAVNKLFSAKEIVMDKLTITLYPHSEDTTKSLVLTFTDIDIDLSRLNTNDLSFFSHLSVSYQGILEEMDIEYQTDGYLYLNHRGHALKLDTPETLHDVFKLLSSIGFSIAGNNSASDVTMVDIVKKITEITPTCSVSTTLESGYQYDMTVSDFAIKDTSISRLDFLLLSDSGNVPSSLKSKDKVLIRKESETTGVSFSLEGSFRKIGSVSTYQTRSTNGYLNITNQDTALLSTITSLFEGDYTSNVDENNKKKSQFNIAITGSLSKKVNDTTNTSTISGSLKADLSDMFQDENFGEYQLSLQQKDSASNKIYNDISAYFNKKTTYLKLNDLFRGRIENSNLKDLFSTISKLTENGNFEKIDDDLNLILSLPKKNDLQKILSSQNDLSPIYQILRSYQVDDSSFSLTFSGSSIGLEDNDITLKISYLISDKEKRVKEITLQGIKISDITLDNLTFIIQPYEDIVIPSEEDYPDYSDKMTIFEDLSDLIDKKKVNAEYTLTYKDQNDVTFNASGNISADLSSSSITTTDDTKTISTSTGNYHLSFDFPKTGNPSDLVSQGLEAYYDGTSQNLFFGYQYYQNENYTLTKDSDHYVFHNSLPHSEIAKIYTLLRDKVDTNEDADASQPVFAMETLVSALTDSEKFQSLKEDLNNNLALSSLDGILSITQDEDKNIQLSLDPSEFLINTKYASNTSTIYLTLSEDNTIANLSIKGKVNGSTIAFSMDLSDDVKEYTKFNTTDYPSISEGEALISSFAALPTDLKQFDLSLTGSVKDKNKSIPSIEIESGSGASVDVTGEHNEASGILLLNHPDINDSSKLIDFNQKVEFSYLESADKTKDQNNREVNNGLYSIEYNDNMHIKMENADIFSLLSNVNSVQNEDNLLYRYLKFLNSATESSGSPLMDLVNGKSLSASKILYYPYINSISFDESSITLDVDPKIIQSDSKEGSTAEITIGYDKTDKHITSATIHADYVRDDTTLTIQASLNLSTGNNKKYQRTSSDILSYSYSTRSQFVDMNGFVTLTDCLIDTTENNFFEIKGTLNLSTELLSFSVKGLAVNCYCYAAIYVQDETAYAYLRFKTDNKNISEDGFYGTEFFIEEKKVLCNRITTDRSSTGLIKKRYTYTSTAEYYKTTAKNIEDNLAYYILDYVLNLQGQISTLGVSVGSIALNQIYDSVYSDSSSSSVTINNDFSKVITSAVYSNNTFDMKLNLNNLFTKIPAVTFDDNTQVKVKHSAATASDGTTKQPFSSISVDTKVTMAINIVSFTLSSSSGNNTFSLIKLTSITAEEAKNNYLKRYYSFRENYENENGTYDSTQTSPYLISKVTEAGKPTATGDKKNPSVSKKNSSSGDKTNYIDYSAYWYFNGAF